MRAVVGSWKVGPMVAHYSLILLCYRHNLNTNFNRNNATNFGHTELRLIDRLQDRIQEINGVTIYPTHKNVSSYKPVEFVSVGIGPLFYGAGKYVEEGDPDVRLKNDIRLMAEQMKVTMPPLMIAHKDERRIFNDFMTNNSKLTKKKIEDLCAIFKEKANGMTIFPKLPSMIKKYETNWKKTR